VRKQPTGLGEIFRAPVFWATLVATALIIGFCVQIPPRSVPAEAIKAIEIDDVVVNVRHDGAELVVHYPTLASIHNFDCKHHAAEMPEVWKLVVENRLNAYVQRVVLFPEDPSLRSVAMTFVKSVSGHWSTLAPCRISIPAN
jgi:hypothetical protein